MAQFQFTQRTTRSSKREPDLTSLINIVFLILIFFIVAGTLRPFSARDIKLATVAPEATQAASPSTLIAHADGRITYAGRAVELVALTALVRARPGDGDARPFTIIADGRLPGDQLLGISRALRQAGIERVSVMVEKIRP